MEITEKRTLIHNSDEGEWLPIGLDAVRDNDVAPCDLFRPAGNSRFVLMAQKDLALPSNFKQRMLDIGLTDLFIRSDEVEYYMHYLQRNLQETLRDPFTPPERKAAVVYGSCREIFRKVFEDPRATFINSSMGVIEPTVDFIISNDTAVKCLFQLTSYDESTYTHCTNVGIFGVALARRYFGANSEDVLRSLGAGFFLHDIGKCRIPIEILNKPGPLTDEERRIVNLHPQDGFDILQDAGVMTEEIKILTMQHHERDDGCGYPLGLAKNEIHPFARICRLVDVYEALTAKRPYHQPRRSFEALKLMKEKVVTDMDQELFDYFIRLFI